MKHMILPARSVAALVIIAGLVAAGHAQGPDAFRIGANTAQNLTIVDPGLERQFEEAFTSARTGTNLSVTANVTFRQMNRAEYAVPVSVRIAPASELAVGRRERSRFDFL